MPSGVDDPAFDLRPFLADATARGALQAAWFMIAIEYGFEIWTNGQGMAVNSLSATVRRR